MERLMTVSEVAENLKIKPEILRRKVRSGQIGAYKVGKAWRFSESEMRRFLDSCLSSSKRREEAQPLSGQAGARLSGGLPS